MQRRIIHCGAQSVEHFWRDALVLSNLRPAMHETMTDGRGCNSSGLLQRGERVPHCRWMIGKYNLFSALLSILRPLDPKGAMRAANLLRFSFTQQQRRI